MWGQYAIGPDRDPINTSVAATITQMAPKSKAIAAMVSYVMRRITTATTIQAASAGHCILLQRRRSPGDPQALVEAYLAAVQVPQATGAGTWNVPWAWLSPARQVAARAAATPSLPNLSSTKRV